MPNDVLRGWQLGFYRDKLAQEEEELKSQVSLVEDKYRESLAILEDGERQLEQMEADYKNLQEADKLLDKNFKREFPGLGFHQLDSLYKLFKKRPKVVPIILFNVQFGK